MSTKGCLISTVSWLMNLRVKYDKISQDEEYKSRTMYFGIYSIITSIIVGAAFVLVLWGIIACFNALDNSGLSAIALYVIIAILALVEITLLCEMFLGGLMGVMYQLRCNRRPIGYIALIVFAVVAIGAIAGIILLLNYA